MTDLDENTCEQLSAWMDGALSPDEARFLERRLEHDVALREKWERMQVASSCLRGHGLRPMPATLSTRIADAIAAQPRVARPANRWIGWAVAASVAVAMVAIAPRFMGETPTQETIAATPATAATPVDAATPDAAPSIDASHQPTPGAADLISSTPTSTMPADAIASAEVPAVSLSPEDFPLDPSAQPKSWPRSSAPGGADAAMEGYLVRHSEMAGGDGLGGFMPYLDVVAGGEAETPDATEPATKQERK